MGIGPVRGGINAQPNVTPLIDVMLVMIMTFMVALMLNRVMEFQLAQERASATREVARPIVLELPDSGGYVLNHQGVAVADLGRLLRSIYSARVESVLFIRSGPQRRYQEVITAMDVANGAGVRVLAFAP